MDSQQALKNLQSYQAGMKNPADILAAKSEQLGVNQAGQQVSGLRQAITNTTNLLNQIAPGVQGRTAGSLVTAGQQNRMIQNEQAPVSTRLSQQTQDFGTAQSAYDRLFSQAQAAANADVTGQQQQLANLQSIYSNLYNQEQAKAARELEQQKLAEQIRQFNEDLAYKKAAAAASAASSYATPTYATSGSANTGAATPAQSVEQNAYNDVKTRINQGNDSQIVSDYKATLKSANYGNQRDKYKIQIYKQLRPDLFLPIGAKFGQYFGGANASFGQF